MSDEREQRIAELVDPIVSARGADVEFVDLRRAGKRTVVVVAVDTDGGVSLDDIADFYSESARAANRTTVTRDEETTMAGLTVRRLDSTTGDRLQTVVTWASADADVVNVVITNDLPDPKIEAAISAFGGR